MKPYTLLLRAMEEKGLIAIGKLAMRQKEQLVAIRPHEGHLTVEMLLYPDEVRPFEGIDVSDVKVSKDEMKMAFALIDMLHEPFDPAAFQDEYRDVLMNMITTKLEGGEVVISSPEEAPAQTVDLMAALRASIEATKSRKTGASTKAAAKAEPVSEDADETEDGDDEAEAAPKPKRASKAAASTATRTRKKTAAR